MFFPNNIVYIWHTFKCHIVQFSVMCEPYTSFSLCRVDIQEHVFRIMWRTLVSGKCGGESSLTTISNPTKGFKRVELQRANPSTCLIGL